MVPINRLSLQYTVVSLLATAADLTVFSALALISTQYNALATLIGMLVGAVISWLLHRYWVFAHSTVSPGRQQFRYITGIVLTVVLNVGLMAVFADWLEFPRFPTRIITSVLVWAILFWFNRRIVFNV
jgi:putative flippase GtrA